MTHEVLGGCPKGGISSKSFDESSEVAVSTSTVSSSLVSRSSPIRNMPVMPSIPFNTKLDIVLVPTRQRGQREFVSDHLLTHPLQPTIQYVDSNY